MSDALYETKIIVSEIWSYWVNVHISTFWYFIWSYFDLSVKRCDMLIQKEFEPENRSFWLGQITAGVTPVYFLFASKHWSWFEICDPDWSSKPFNFCSNYIHVLPLGQLKVLRIGRFQPFVAGVNTLLVCGSLLSLTKGITKRKDCWNLGVWLSMDHLCHVKIF